MYSDKPDLELDGALMAFLSIVCLILSIVFAVSNSHVPDHNSVQVSWFMGVLSPLFAVASYFTFKSA